MSVSLHVSERNQWRVLTLSGRVDAFSDKRIVMNLRQSVPRPSCPVVLDLQKCEFLSIWALRSLLSWKEEVTAAGGRLVLMSPPDGLRRQLDVFLGRGLEIFYSWEALEIETFFQSLKGSSAEEPAPKEPAWLPGNPRVDRADPRPN